MKTRKLLIIALALALLAVYYLWGTDYRQQRREQAALAAQIGEATQALAQVAPVPAGLEARLAAATARRDAVAGTFPDRLNSNEVVRQILRLAEDSGVKAVPLATQAWAEEEGGGQRYGVFRLNVTATGALPRLAGFLDRLENGEMATLVIEELNVTRQEDGTASASLGLAIYTRPPAGEGAP